MEPYDEIDNMLSPDALFWAMEPFGPPMGDAACATWNPAHFPTQRDQQAAFDGESTMPERDIPQAREMCRKCPLLESCRRYGLDSRDDHAFLAGETVEERRRTWRKSGEIAKRRRRVAALHDRRVPTTLIASLLGRDESSIRNDLRELGKRPYDPLTSA
ncbi:WhiB family transcriptional regulator [Kitasatospora aureofaciens]|uniref:WhiB family transcriptional regulator n=1 Tax=Kitasatospora aureofaciens TaxID=1894 RepID=UPI001D638B90|nr:WhiB family transcriptional regulator [Kitasatospora aureofaciens]HJD84145.1 WhiB family transcriptional regulator [Kitasatospora aureofaciens]